MYGRWPLQERVSKHNTAPQMFIELDSDFGPRERLLTWKAAPPCTDVFTSSVSVYETCSAQSEITHMDVISMTWVSSQATDAGTDEVCRPSGWFCGLGWWVVVAVGVAMRLAFGRLGIWWASVRCLVLVGGVALGVNLGGNPARKNHFHMGRTVWLPRTSREGGVGSVLLLTCIYEEWCLFINYLKWTAGTPSVCGLNFPL